MLFELVKKRADAILVVPETLDEFMPVLTAVPLQFLAYHIAVLKGTDVDQPRNLAKSNRKSLNLPLLIKMMRRENGRVEGLSDYLSGGHIPGNAFYAFSRETG
jgi:hypothetical protein